MIYTGKRKKLHKTLYCLVAVALLLLALTAGCEKLIAGLTPRFVRVKSEIICSKSISEAVDSSIEKLGYTYDELAKIKYDNQNKVRAIETDSVKINRLKSEVTRSVQNKIEDIRDASVEIPLGAFTQITVLSNFGPKLNVSFNLKGSFNCAVISSFEQAGINQTVHHISIRLTSRIVTTSLEFSEETEYSTDFEVAQSVIVGDIPTGYGSIYGAY